MGDGKGRDWPLWELSDLRTWVLGAHVEEGSQVGRGHLARAVARVPAVAVSAQHHAVSVAGV